MRWQYICTLSKLRFDPGSEPSLSPWFSDGDSSPSESVLRTPRHVAAPRCPCPRQTLPQPIRASVPVLCHNAPLLPPTVLAQRLSQRPAPPEIRGGRLKFRLGRLKIPDISPFHALRACNRPPPLGPLRHAPLLSQPAVADPRFIGPIDRHIVNNSHIFSEIFQQYL